MAKQIREKPTHIIVVEAAEYFSFLAEGKRSCNVADLMAAADYASRLAEQLRTRASAIAAGRANQPSAQAADQASAP